MRLVKKLKYVVADEAVDHKETTTINEYVQRIPRKIASVLGRTMLEVTILSGSKLSSLRSRTIDPPMAGFFSNGDDFLCLIMRQLVLNVNDESNSGVAAIEVGRVVRVWREECRVKSSCQKTQKVLQFATRVSRRSWMKRGKRWEGEEEVLVELTFYIPRPRSNPIAYETNNETNVILRLGDVEKTLAEDSCTVHSFYFLDGQLKGTAWDSVRWRSYRQAGVVIHDEGFLASHLIPLLNGRGSKIESPSPGWVDHRIEACRSSPPMHVRTGCTALATDDPCGRHIEKRRKAKNLGRTRLGK